MSVSIASRIAIAALAAASLTAGAASAQAIHVVDATEKVYQSDTTLPNAGTSAVIRAAQNEFEAFQIVVTGPATNVSIRANTLTGPGGATLVPSTAGHQGAIMVYREAFFNITRATDPGAKTGQAPDALIPQVDEFYHEARNATVASVAAGKNAIFFVDIHVPANATPGVYTGSVTVNYNGTSAGVPVTLTVWPFALPSSSHLKSYIPFEWNAATTQYPSIASHCCDDVVAQMHLLHAMIGVNHRVTIDSFDYGSGDLNALKRNFGPLFDGTANTLLAGAHPTVVTYQGKHGSTNKLATWKSFFDQQGWGNYLYDYAADEPGTGRTSNWCTVLANTRENTNAGVRSIVTTSMAQAKVGKCTTSGSPYNGQTVNLSTMNVFVPVVDQVQPASMGTGQNTMSQYTAWKAGSLGGRANEVWQYQSCDSWGCSGSSATGWPSRAIDHSAIRARAMEWLSFRNGVTGELYWGSTVAWTGLTQQPWTNQYSTYGNGDGTIFYPGVASSSNVGGTHDIPLASLRLKMLREGMEDYEYFYLLGQLGDAAFANAQIDGVFATAHAVTGTNPNTLYNARNLVACRIIALQHPSWTCDPATWTTGGGTTPPPATVMLTVGDSGTGSGTIVSSVGGINCGSACTATLAAGTNVTLTATPANGSTFGGFSGACTSATTTCTFNVSVSSTVDAAFAAIPVTNNFSIGLSPASNTVVQGTAAAYSINTAVTSGAAQTVNLSVSGLPTGAAAGFSPASITAGAGSTLNVTTAATTPAGTYGLTISAAGSSTTKVTTATLVVTAVPVAGSIAFRAMSTYVSQSSSTKSIALKVPATVQAKDALLATLFIGDYEVTTAPVVTAPAGWTLVRKINQGAAGLLLVYSHVAVAADVNATFTWTTNAWVGAAASMTAYSGTNATAPVDASNMLANGTAGSTYSTPTVTTTATGDQLIAVHAGYMLGGSWAAPAGMTQRVKLNNGTGGLLAIGVADLSKPAAGVTTAYAAKGTPNLSYALTAIIALKK